MRFRTVRRIGELRSLLRLGVAGGWARCWPRKLDKDSMAEKMEGHPTMAETNVIEVVLKAVNQMSAT